MFKLCKMRSTFCLQDVHLPATVYFSPDAFFLRVSRTVRYYEERTPGCLQMWIAAVTVGHFCGVLYFSVVYLH